MSVGPAGRGDGARAVHGALGDLRIALEQAALPLNIPSADEARRHRLDVLHQMEDYILPRYEQLGAPLLAVIGGSTGAGKSTLINAMLRTHMATTSPVRPTTRRPLLVHNPADEPWFSDARVLPSLARVRRAPDAEPAPVAEGTTTEIEIRASERLPEGLALLDAPDIDSVVDENRALARQLLSAADLWVFVTTAARYADAVPWALLREAAERRIVVAIVLDRIPAGVGVEVRADLAARLEAEGLQRAPLFAISETTMGEDGLLPEADVAPLMNWLSGLAADATSRAAVARQTLGGAVDLALDSALVVADGVQAQLHQILRLEDQVDRAYEQALERVIGATEDGALLRGEVLARWQEFVGTGEFFRTLESQVGRMRDRIGNFFRGKPAPVTPVEEAIEDGLLTLLVTEIERASTEAEFSWRAEPGTRQVLAQALDRLPTTDTVRAQCAEVIRDWQSALLDMVREQGADKRFTARMLSFGVSGLGVALMIVIFASTAGLTGAEVAVAGGTAVVAQRLLEAVFGEDAVRAMTKAAREDLQQRCTTILDEHSDAWRTALDDLGVDEHAAGRMQTIVQRVHEARRAEVGR